MFANKTKQNTTKGLREFLARADELFELHIFTHASRDYGKQIADILDPTGRLFSAQEG
jgi:TFIIF-interacting CTD phosphatase-like protein